MFFFRCTFITSATHELRYTTLIRSTTLRRTFITSTTSFLRYILIPTHWLYHKYFSFFRIIFCIMWRTLQEPPLIQDFQDCHQLLMMVSTGLAHIRWASPTVTFASLCNASDIITTEQNFKVTYIFLESTVRGMLAKRITIKGTASSSVNICLYVYVIERPWAVSVRC